MPITLPLNITSVMYIQVRLIAAIAFMNGTDIRNDKVKTLVFACLTGSAMTDVFKEVGVEIGSKAMVKIIKKIPNETIKEINKAVGFKLLTKFGETGAINLVKLVPVASGLIGGGLDAAATRKIGHVAKKAFI